MTDRASRRVVYLSHPLGYRNGEATVEHQDNLYHAGLWLRWLIESTGWAVTMPWHPYVMFLPESSRPRALVDQLFMLERADLVAFCGGRMTAHMRFELAHAQLVGRELLDLIDLGETPPAVEPAEAWRLIEERMR